MKTLYPIFCLFFLTAPTWAQENSSAGDLDLCKSNLQTLGTALEKWATNNSGLYPDTMGQLFPDYLATPLLCPTKDSDTYSTSYYHGEARFWCQLRCTGDHTGADLPKGLPAYTSEWGLITTTDELKLHYKREPLLAPPLTR